jgi:hypothetical protein
MTTPLDALIGTLIRAGEHDLRAEAAPAALLWCDPGQEFAALIPLLRERLPGLLTFGDYDPETRRGPAISLRAAAGRALPEPGWPADRPAIVYVPGVGRETLRATETCPLPLSLLAWLAVAGALFGHPNGRDWTLRGFLASKPAYAGLGLELGQDEATRAALAAAAAKLFLTPIDELRGQRLDAAALHALLAPDMVADALDWLGGKLSEATDPPTSSGFGSARGPNCKSTRAGWHRRSRRAGLPGGRAAGPMSGSASPRPRPPITPASPRFSKPWRRPISLRIRQCGPPPTPAPRRSCAALC